MQEAIKIAEKAKSLGEVPIGAVIVHNDKIIASAHNKVELLKDATAHCELLAINYATKILGDKYLNDCELYVTIEPCAMCSGALVLSKIKKVIFGAWNNKSGACGSLYMIPSDRRLNHRVEIISGIMEKECSDLMKNYFENL